MDLERSPDRRAGVALAARRRTTHPDTVTRLTGRTSLVGTRQGSTFRMWLDDQSDFPLRIEFQPRSYLRIVLESQPAAAQPNIQRTEEP